MILQTEFTRPDTWRAKAETLLGPPPEAGLPNAARNRHATDLLLRIGLPEVKPDVVFIWYSDPDTTAHARGLDAAETRASLAAVDGEIGRIEDWLRDQGRLATTNLLVTSDHGFSAHTGGFDLPAAVKPFVRQMTDGTPDIVTAGGAVHFRSGPDEARVTAIVEALQKQPAVGAIFTRARTPGDPTGHVLGTLSFDLIGWGHRRAGEILVSAAWSEGTGSGPRGSATGSGTAGHGSTSPYEVKNTLVAAGPDFREAFVSTAATGNVDITPTCCSWPASTGAAAKFDGRVLGEALRTAKLPPPPRPGGTVVPSRDGAIPTEAHTTTGGQRALLRFRQGDPPAAAVRPLRPQTRNSSARHWLDHLLDGGPLDDVVAKHGGGQLRQLAVAGEAQRNQLRAGEVVHPSPQLRREQLAQPQPLLQPDHPILGGQGEHPAVERGQEERDRHQQTPARWSSRVPARAGSPSSPRSPAGSAARRSGRTERSGCDSDSSAALPWTALRG